MEDLVEASYRRQEQSARDVHLPSRFSAPDSVDNWRHDRMLQHARTLVQAMPQARWLTVGDGMYGSDAAYLKSVGADATASSLVTDTLHVAAERGWIGAFREENAEHISLADESMDFVLCKAAYHHFPRPPIALYEMLRVARVGVVLLEPIDGTRVLDGLRYAFKVLVRGDRETRFEVSGNYIYRINIDEIAKLMTAVGQTHIAYRCFNDFYMPGLGADPASGTSRGHLLTRLGLGVQDLLCRAGLLAWGLAAVVVFKGRPAPELVAAMERGGYTIRALPVNPYAGAGQP